MIKLNKMVKKDKKTIWIQHGVYTFYITNMDSFQVGVFNLCLKRIDII